GCQRLERRRSIRAAGFDVRRCSLFVLKTLSWGNAYRAAPIAASMTWQGTETAGLAAEGPEQREGWRDPSVLLRDGKSRESSGRRKTREVRHCKTSGGAAGFRASRVLRGGEARARHGEAQGFRLRTNRRLAQARSPTTLMSALAHALKEKRAPENGPSQRPEMAWAGKLHRRECFRGS